MARRLLVSQSVYDRLAPWYGESLRHTVPVLQGSLAGLLFGLMGENAVTINGTLHWTRYAPDVETPEGTVLLGHELFHVVQQQEMG